MMKGDKLTAAERTELAKKLARFTGLRPEFIAESNFRVTQRPVFQRTAARSAPHHRPL